MMISLEGTDESSILDDTAKLSIRTVIGQFPLLKSIFRLMKEIFSPFRNQHETNRSNVGVRQPWHHPSCLSSADGTTAAHRPGYR